MPEVTMQNVEVEVLVNIDLVCSECSKDLKAKQEDADGPLQVEPCEVCINKAHEEGYDGGRDDCP